jgi:predicted Ser/Thr protein kinase
MSDIKYGNDLGINLSTCVFIGNGTSGQVYLISDRKVIKIFYNADQCKNEYEILNAVKGDKHFPEVYDYKGNSMIREYIDGIKLSKYIRHNGLSRNLSIKIIELMEDFKRIGFKRIDMRCNHIYVQQDESIRVIDPRAHFTLDVPYPKLLFRGLKKLRVLSDFMLVLKETRPVLYEEWGKIL